MRAKKPKIIEDVGFDFRWDSEKVWALDEPVVEMPIENLLWHFDVPFWEKDGTDDWNLTPWEVIRKSGSHEEHYKRVLDADMSHPVDIMENKGRWLLLDGLHRLVKAYVQGRKKVCVRIIPRRRIPEIIRKEKI